MKNYAKSMAARVRPAGILLVLSLLVISPDVLAYLDPSTGSMVVSAIVGIFASVALAMKTYWYRIKKFFRRDEKSQPGPAGDPAAKE